MDDRPGHRWHRCAVCSSLDADLFRLLADKRLARLGRRLSGPARPGCTAVSRRVRLAWQVPYRRLLIVSISAQGIGLRLLPLAGLFAPPLLIPWSQIERVRQLRMLGTTTHYEVNLRGGRHTLGVLGKVGPAIHQAWVEHAGRS